MSKSVLIVAMNIEVGLESLIVNCFVYNDLAKD